MPPNPQHLMPNQLSYYIYTKTIREKNHTNFLAKHFFWRGVKMPPCPSSAPCLTNLLIIYQKIGEKMFLKNFSQIFFRGGGAKCSLSPPCLTNFLIIY